VGHGGGAAVPRLVLGPLLESGDQFLFYRDWEEEGVSSMVVSLILSPLESFYLCHPC